MQSDAWEHLRNRTSARIALGRAGGSLPTQAWLAFSADHAEARDAVHSTLDVQKLSEALGPGCLHLRSRAQNRSEYLKRPDLGRRLDEPSAAQLKRSAANADVVLIIADGLSATAAQQHAVAMTRRLIENFHQRQLTIAPICLIQQARVAIQDEIGALIGAKAAVILIGERPGLGVADSLGAYLVYQPRIGKTDSERNCVSNIRPSGLPIEPAADTVAWLVEQAIARRLSGVELKDERQNLLASPTKIAARL